MCESRPKEERQLVLKLSKVMRPFEIVKATGIPKATVGRWLRSVGPLIKKVIPKPKPKPIDTTNMYQVTTIEGLEFKVEKGKAWRWAESLQDWVNTTRPVEQVLAKMHKDRDDGIAQYRNREL